MVLEIGKESISEPSMVKSCRPTGVVHRMKVSRMYESSAVPSAAAVDEEDFLEDGKLAVGLPEFGLLQRKDP